MSLLDIYTGETLLCYVYLCICAAVAVHLYALVSLEILALYVAVYRESSGSIYTPLRVLTIRLSMQMHRCI